MRFPPIKQVCNNRIQTSSMTIYIYFLNNKMPMQIHNVGAVTDDGRDAVRVKMMGTDADPCRFENVSHVIAGCQRRDHHEDA